jgi:AraC-like DNA-binding protein
MISIKKIFYLLFFISIRIFSQNSFNDKASLEIDSLIKKDQWESVQFKLKNNPIKFNDFSGFQLKYQVLFRLNNAFILQQESKYDEAKKSVLYSLSLIQNNKKQLGTSSYESLKHMAITRLFYIEKRLGNINRGLYYIITFSKDMSSPYRKKQMILFAVAYIELGNYKKSIDILNIHLGDINNNLYNWFSKDLETAATCNTKGDTFIKWHKDTGEKKFLDSAYQNYANAYNTIKKSPNFSAYSFALYNVRKASIALLKKQYTHSLFLLNKCEKDSSLMSKTISKETVWIGKAEVYTALKKPDSAFYYINKLYNKKSSSKCTYENKLKIYHLLSVNYENIRDDKNAYKFAKLSLAEIDKKNIQNTSVTNFLGKYEQQEIRSISEETIKENKKHTFLLIVCTILISIVVIFYIKYRYNKKKKMIFMKIQKKNDEKQSLQVTVENNKNLIVIEDELIDRVLKNLELLESEKKFLSNDFKLDRIAKALNTNTAYLSKIINEHKGISFSEYVNDLRINYLLKELQENQAIRKYTIQTISEECGYKSPTTFIKAFRDRIKMTPSDYIKEVNKTIER